MRINVLGEKVSDNIVNMYVNEYVKAHPEKNIASLDIIVEGDFIKIRCEHYRYDNIA